MSKKTYQEKLKDPRWQKKRLKALEDKGWKCQLCDKDKETLNVHHSKYTGEPWDADDKDLMVLCDNCHKIAHSHPDFTKELIRCKSTKEWEKLKHPIGFALIYARDEYRKNPELPPVSDFFLEIALMEIFKMVIYRDNLNA